MKTIPRFALGGDVVHGPGPSPRWDTWWSALALGADGLACKIYQQGTEWFVAMDGEQDAPPSLQEFFYIFGAACPLLLVLPVDSPPVSSADLKNLEQLLLEAALLFTPSVVLSESQFAAFAALTPVPLYVHSPCSNSMAFPKQAWSMRPAEDLHAEDLYLWLLEVPLSGPPLLAARCMADFGGGDATAGQALVLHERFDGAEALAVHARWALGYSNLRRESFLSLGSGKVDGPGLRIEMVAGNQYSGGGAVLRAPVLGDFDVQVEFSASAPAQGSTLELAAITIDPPPHRGVAELDRTKLVHRHVSLVFDVHGTPPYVSSECDEDNGFRIGWNRSYTLTRTSDEPWLSPEGQVGLAPAARSDNLYNRYGRDVVPPAGGGNPSMEGALRLVRKGAFFASYFRAAVDAPWLCSGTQWNAHMPGQIYVRLAAKHWLKDGQTRAPAQTVCFFNFRCYQAAWS